MVRAASLWRQWCARLRCGAAAGRTFPAAGPRCKTASATEVLASHHGGRSASTRNAVLELALSLSGERETRFVLTELWRTAPLYPAPGRCGDGLLPELDGLIDADRASPATNHVNSRVALPCLCVGAYPMRSLWSARRWRCAVDFDVTDIAGELAHLQRNRGLQSADLGARVGPRLAQLTGYSPHRGADSRASLVRQLMYAASGLPPDLRLAFARACAVRPDDKRTLTERLAVVGKGINRSAVVARRRLADANLLVAGRLLENLTDDKGWFLAEMRAHIDLRDRTVRNGNPTYRGEYQLVVTAESVSRITEMISLTGEDTDPQPKFATTGAARVETVRQVHSQTWECVLTLDRTYHCGEVINYESAIRVARRESVPPMLVAAPRRDCRLFTTEVHLGDLADEVWVLDGVTPPTVFNDTPTGARIDPKVDPPFTAEFRNLTPGLAYGLRWTWRDPGPR